MADWDVSNPEDGDIVSQYPQNARAARAAVVTNFGVDHRATDDSDIGKHEVVKLLAQTTPTAVAGQGHFYTKDVGSGVIELFYQDPAGNETKLTNAGVVSFTGIVLLTANLVDGILSADATGRAKMADGYITTAKLAAALLSADAAGRGKMADRFVTTAKLADNSVTNDKVATGTLGAEKFQTGTTESDWIAANTTAKTVTASDTVRWVSPALQGVYTGVFVNNIFDVPADTQFAGTSVIITASGSVRSVLALSVTNGAYIQILKNGVAEAVNNYSSSTGNNETWTVDVSVSVGDVLQIAVSTGDNSNSARGTSWTLGGDAEFTV